MTIGQLPGDLRDSIVACGYFPEFVEATIAQSVGSEQVQASVVHHEATFNNDAIHRHVTVLVLTATRLIVGHTDDGDSPGVSQALTTVETVPLRKIRSVSLTQVASHPERYGKGRRGDAVAEAWLVVGWGAVRRVEIEPASCADPTCEADHGYTAEDVSDDLTIRVSTAADGERSVQQLIRFALQLQQAAV